MDDLISKFALRMQFAKDCHGECDICVERCQESGECMLIIAAPVVDAAPIVHAHWIIPTYIGSYRAEVPHCSACDGIPAGVDEKTKYCPHCGARMDAKENKNE